MNWEQRLEFHEGFRMEEIWKDIYGYEGLYQVSNQGRIKSLPKKDGFYLTPERFLQGGISNNYRCVTLCKNGKQKSFSIHRLVAKAFVPNPDNLPQINHKDENKLNNRYDNLEWCTSAYNVNYGNCISKRAKTQRDSKCQINNPASSVKIRCFENNEVYPSIREAERQLNIDGSCISKVCRGKRKQVGGYTFSYI